MSNYHAYKLTFTHGRAHFSLPLGRVLFSLFNQDILASYPRSGSTWLRTMITNVVYPEAMGNPQITNKVIPGIKLGNFFQALKSPAPHILKTHSNYYPLRKHRALYLMRDARHAVLSLFRYTTTRQNIDMPYEVWFSLYKNRYLGPRWDDNVRSWLSPGNNTRMNPDIFYLKYEDMQEDPKAVLKEVCDYFQIPYNEDALTRAIELTSVNNLRNWETIIKGRFKNENASFYRGGRSNEWATLLTDSQREEFLALHENALKMANYL